MVSKSFISILVRLVFSTMTMALILPFLSATVLAKLAYVLSRPRGWPHVPFQLKYGMGELQNPVRFIHSLPTVHLPVPQRWKEQ